MLLFNISIFFLVEFMPTQKIGPSSDEVKSYQKIVQRLTLITYLSFAIGVIAIIISLTTLVLIGGVTVKPTNLTKNITTTANTTDFGSTLAGIDQPLNATQLAVINNAPNSYFERAGEYFLNGSIQSPYQAGLPTHAVNAFITNNKVSVIYVGSITCIFCGENRWAMALALSRFGNFSQLFNGYSSFGDDDVPTLYWAQVDYNGSTDDITNHYSSKYINFLTIEDTHPITGGFNLNSLAQIISNVKDTGNTTDYNALEYALAPDGNSSIGFDGGTPYTIWGTSQFDGADTTDFGNITATGQVQLTDMTHQQILNLLSDPTTKFGLVEYVGADIYIASVCKSLNTTYQRAVQACSLPAIGQIETLMK